MQWRDRLYPHEMGAFMSGSIQRESSRYWIAVLAFSATTVDNDALSLRILHFNLDRHNSQPEKVLQYLDNQTVDLLSLQEVTPEWDKHLRSHLTHYQIAAAEVRQNSQGSTLLIPTNASRILTLQSTKTLHLPEGSERPLLVGEFSMDGQSLLFLSLHTTRPRSQATVDFQRRELAAITQWSQAKQAQGQHVIAMGDFNSTSWTRGFQNLLRRGNLVNSQQGYGWQTTWLAGWPSVLRIAIDHCLYSDGFITINRSIGPALGSDHRPLIVELQLARDIR